MNTPSEYQADNLKDFNTQTEKRGRWVAARPMGNQGLYLKLRFQRAWMVFTGKADILTWRDQ